MERKNLGFLGFPLYDICSNGDVISLSYRGGAKEKKLMPHKDTKGYLQVGLRNDNGKRHFIVHRLVAYAFIPNPNNLSQINHKDEDKTNNCVDNLEWCNNRYNSNYGTRNKRMANTLKGKRKPWFQKKVEQLDLNNNHIRYFESFRDAKEETGATHISHVCRGILKTSGGYKWRYV